MHRLDVSGDGQLLLSASAQQQVKTGQIPASEVRLWDLRTGVCLQELVGHQSRVTSVAMSDDAKVLASAEIDGKIIFWDAATGRPKLTCVSQNGIRDIVLNRDGSRLFSVGLDKTIRIWDTQTGVNLMVEQFPTFLNTITLSPDERRLLVGNLQSKATLLEISPP